MFAMLTRRSATVRADNPIYEELMNASVEPHAYEALETVKRKYRGTKYAKDVWEKATILQLLTRANRNT